MKPSISIRKALADPNLLGGVLAGESWQAWRVLMIASMGEELLDEERAIFTKLTGRARFGDDERAADLGELALCAEGRDLGSVSPPLRPRR